jgi:GMC oxidoreductase
VLIRADGGRRFQIEVHMPSDDLFAQSENSLWQPSRTRSYSAMARSFAPVAGGETSFVEPGPTDAPGDYTVHLDYSSSAEQLLEEMSAGLDQIRAALGADRSERIERFGPGDSHHEAGGLAMGKNPQQSVTNPFGSFHPVPNLVAVDASTWPTVSPTNPCLTITAIARRQAEQLIRTLSTP